MQYYKRLIEHKALVAILLFLLSFGTFSFSLKNNFVWDDVEVIEKNYYSFKSAHITSIVIPKEQEKVIAYYRPMVPISMVVDWDIWGVSPFGFHLSNIIFHSISTVIFYFLVLVVLGEFGVDGKESVAFLSSILFALHPMHVESVSWVAGRTDVLCGLFFFLAFTFHILSYRKLRLLVLSALCFFLSLISKEVALAFPIVALGFDLLNRRRANQAIMYSILRYTAYAGLVLIYFYLREKEFASVPGLSGEVVQQSTHNIYRVWEVLKVLLSSYLFYVNKLVFPFDFNAFIGIVPKGLYYLVSSTLVILILCVIGFISIKKKEDITAFSIFWIFTSLGPSSLIAIFNISSAPLAERYLYIPSAGYCMLIGYLIFKAGERIKNQKAVWAFIFLLSLLYLLFSIQRQGVWKDNLALWSDTSEKSPYYAIVHSNYGMALRDAGKTDEAIRELSIALNPEVKDTMRGRAATANNLGLAHIDKEDYRGAEKWFLKALYYDSTYGKTYYHLGLIYFIKGENGNSVSDYRTAEGYLKKTLEMYISYGRANLLLAKVYMRLGEREEAREQAKMALRSGLIEPLSTEARGILNGPEK
ncbi:MAG: tetratricopeptide repeat protein [Ignavibacteriales bacterium]